MKLGVCYYPEHWPQEQWPSDAARMVELGIEVVRIGEFAWSRLEPSDGKLELDWLEHSLDVLGSAGLKVVLGTPTATPPKWLVDKLPDMLAVDERGHLRGFGSRRHYCFSSLSYRRECERIVRVLASHFGQHPAVCAWQTDNEYGCHSTVLSYSDAAKTGFRQWCEQRYGSVGNLNSQWGNVFWSMEYGSFAELDLPSGSVTETNPAHRLAFWRYSSDQVAVFNRIQTRLLRELSPGRDLVHNYMGNFVEFDHYAVAEDLDVASWDSYPLGFLDRDSGDPDELRAWYRTGHPDTSAFHHDLYRGMGKGRWWVMEQQPGPVNWAPHNPSPLAGMVRLWGWEAFAHGAEVMSYFRWRQMPAAQEQLHTGLCLPDGQLDTAAHELKTLGSEIHALDSGTDINAPPSSAPVALLFDYAGDQMQRILRSGGDQYDPLLQVQAVYRACRVCGIDIDILPTTADLSAYRVILLANQVFSDGDLASRLLQLQATIVMFPGSGYRNAECAFPDALAIGEFRRLIDLQVTRSETLPKEINLPVTTRDGQFWCQHWRERIQTELAPEGRFDDGWGFYYRYENVHYLNAVLAQADLNRIIRSILEESGVPLMPCSGGLRFRSRGALRFAFNYGPETATLRAHAEFFIGSQTLEAGDVAIWAEAGSDPD